VKRLFRLTISVAVFVSALGILSPVTAAPVHATTPTLAAMMPANIDLYAELNIGKLTDSLIMLDNTFSPAGAATTPTTIDQLPGQVGTGIQDIDAQLTKLLGHDATLSGDVFNWLNQLAVGVPITDAMLTGASSSAKQMTTPDFLMVGSVKDETAADKFITDILAGIEKQGLSFTKTAVQINGQAATRYNNPLLKISVVRLPGYVLIGADTVLDAMTKADSSKQVSLATNAQFQKTMALLNTDNNMSAFISARVLAYSLTTTMRNSRNAMPLMPGTKPGAVATMSATAAADMTARMADILKAYNGLAIGARTVNKTFALDVVASVDMAAIKAMSTQLYGLDVNQLMGSSTSATVSGKLSSQIPADAFAVIEGHDLTRIYTVLHSVITALNSSSGIPGLNAAQQKQFSNAAAGLDTFEKMLKTQFDLDINTDVLAPLAGDFAVYSYMKPMATDKPSANQLPFNPVLIIDTTDAAKAKTFADKLSAGLPKVANLTPTKTSSGLYTLSVGKAETTLAYGVSGNTFLITTGDAIPTVTDAIAGKNTLDASPTWKTAKAILPATYTSVLYLNMNNIEPYLSSMAPMAGSGADMGLAALSKIDSALIYSAFPDVNSAMLTLAFTLK
jgi:hypothetical protein